MAAVNVIKLVLLGVLTVRDLNKQCYGHDGRLKLCVLLRKDVLLVFLK